jgi:hypothetical protein
MATFAYTALVRKFPPPPRTLPNVAMAGLLIRRITHPQFPNGLDGLIVNLSERV